MNTTIYFNFVAMHSCAWRWTRQGLVNSNLVAVYHYEAMRSGNTKSALHLSPHNKDVHAPQPTSSDFIVNRAGKAARCGVTAQFFHRQTLDAARRPRPFPLPWSPLSDETGFPALLPFALAARQPGGRVNGVTIVANKLTARRSFPDANKATPTARGCNNFTRWQIDLATSWRQRSNGRQRTKTVTNIFTSAETFRPSVDNEP